MSLTLNDLIFIIPGFLCFTAFNITIPGRKKTSFENKILISLSISIFELICLKNVLSYTPDSSTTFPKIMLSIFLLFIIPSLLGFLFGKIILNEKFRSFFGYSHVIETAWDDVFTNIEKHRYISITLTTGEVIRGLFSNPSIASSDINDRDIYISKIFDENWKEPKSKKGILIKSDFIKYIKFYEREKQDVQNEREKRSKKI